MKIINTLITVGLLTCAISSTAIAAQCGDKAPEFIDNPDTYFNIKETGLSAAELEQLTSIYKTIKGKWDGSRLDLSCHGNQSNPETREQTARVKATISYTDKDLRISTENKYNESHKIENELFLLFDKNITDKLSVSATQISAIQKFRKAVNNGGSVLMDRRVHLDMSNGHVRLTIENYLNGTYVGMQSLILD